MKGLKKDSTRNAYSRSFSMKLTFNLVQTWSHPHFSRKSPILKEKYQRGYALAPVEIITEKLTMKNLITVVTLVLISFLVGCTPDKVTITIPSSAVKKVVAGNLAYVRVKAVFSTTGKDSEGNLPKVKSVAIGHLGEGAEIEIDDGDYSSKLTASFKIPFGKPAVLSNAPKSILVLSLDDSGRIEFKDGPGLDALNYDLDDVDSSIEADFCGGDTIFRFTGNTESPLHIQVIGAFANDKPIAIGDVRIDEDDEIAVKFSRKDGSIWHSLNPFINLR